MTGYTKLLNVAEGSPLLFQGAINDWPARKWSPAHLASMLGDTNLQCKISPVDPEDMSWETDCLHLEITMKQYSDWLAGNPCDDSSLYHVDARKYSCYVDYKYMKDMFKDMPHVFKDIFWDKFGLHGRTGADSTLWVGSTGAYTPCHQDTYGFNLIAQLQGRKRWFLFPPVSCQGMYPTRVPFEESSVFSEVNIRCPDLRKHSLFKTVEPFIVELQEGEVLYVPRHWWHFVECLESSVSVNTWVPMKEDMVSQCDEAISRLLFTCIHSALPENEKDQLSVNTNEQLQPLDVNLDYVKTTIMSTGSANDCTSTNIATNQAHQFFDSFCDAFKGHKVYCINTCNKESGDLTESDHGADIQQPKKRLKLDKCSEESSGETEQHPEDVRIYALKKMLFTDYVEFLHREYGSTVDNDTVEVSNNALDASINVAQHSKCILKASKDIVQSSYDAVQTSVDVVRASREPLQTDMHASDEDHRISNDSSEGTKTPNLVDMTYSSDIKEELGVSKGYNSENINITWTDIVNSVLAPEVIDHIRQVIIQKVCKT